MYLTVKILQKYYRVKNIKKSTDYIFDGSSNIPIDEDTKPNPINYYGKSKLFGEISCLIENPLSIISGTLPLYFSSR